MAQHGGKSKRCPSCRSPIHKDSSVCSDCGHPLLRLCHCGKTIHVLDETCPVCGETMRVVVPRRSLLPRIGGLLWIPVALLGRVLAWLAALPGRLLGSRMSSPRTRWIAGSFLALFLAGLVGAAALWFTRDRTPDLIRYFNAGRVALEGQSYATAAEWFRRFMEQNPRHPLARYLYGRSLYGLGRREEAVREVRRALEVDPGREEFVLFLTQAAEEAGTPEDVMALLDDALLRRPDSASLLLRRGELRLKLGQANAAIDDLKRAMNLRPKPPPCRLAIQVADLLEARAEALGRPEDFADAQRIYRLVESWAAPDAGTPAKDEELARACFGRKSYEEAREHVERAIANSSGIEKAGSYVLQARILVAQGASGRAEVSIREALRIARTAEIFLAAAAVWSGPEDLDRRLTLLKDGVEAFPDNEPLFIRCAETLVAAGRGNDAVAELRLKAGASPRAALTLGRTLWMTGEGEEALRALEVASRRFPADVELMTSKLSMQLELFTRQGRPAEGEEWDRLSTDVDALATKKGVRPEAVQALEGRLLLIQGRTEEAIRLLAGARELSAGDPELTLLLGLAYVRASQFDPGIDCIERFIRVTGAPSADIRLLLAEACYGARLYSRCGGILEEVLARSFGRRDARRLLSKVRQAEGKPDLALRELRTALEGAPDDIGAFLELGGLSLTVGDSAGAEKAFARARELAVTPDMALHVGRAEAECYASARRPDEAQSRLERLVAEYPEQPASWLGLADFLMARGRDDEARQVLFRALARYPDEANLRQRLCENILASGGDQEEVARQIGEIERRSPGDPTAGYLRGKLLTLRDQLPEAIGLLERYVANRPKDPNGHFALGAALYRANRLAEAIERLETARTLAPDSQTLSQLLGEALHARAAELLAGQSPEEARRLAERALRYDPDQPGRMVLLAACLGSGGDLAAAEKLCLEAIRKDPVNLNAYRLLCDIRIAKHDLAGAADASHRACTKSDQPQYDHYVLAQIYYRMGRFADAVEEGKLAAQAAKDPTFGVDVIVRGLLAGGKAAVARAFLEDLLKEHPQRADLRAHLGVVLRSQRDFDGALREFDAALALDGSLWGALWQQVFVHLEDRGDLAGAQRLVLLRQSNAPDEPELNCMLGWLSAQKLDRVPALSYLRAALKSRPGYRPAALQLAENLNGFGEFAGAREALAPILSANPRDSEALFLMASSYEGEGKIDAAVERYRETLAADPRHAVALNNLAMHLNRALDTRKEALKLAELAVELVPGNPDFLDTLGRVQMALGDMEAARDRLTEALTGFQERRSQLEILGLRSPREDLRARARAAEKPLADQIDRTKAALKEALRALDGRK